jgi:hypothetical protein
VKDSGADGEQDGDGEGQDRPPERCDDRDHPGGEKDAGDDLDQVAVVGSRFLLEFALGGRCAGRRSGRRVALRKTCGRHFDQLLVVVGWM